MDKVSQLIDGELRGRALRAQLQRIEVQPELAQSWETYYLIRDVLHQEAELRPDFLRRLHERLEQEPIVIAPHMRLSHRVARFTLPLAAGVGGVALVAWLAVSFLGTEPQGTIVAEASKPVSVADRRIDEYVRVHQEFSPRTTIQGVASYVHTVSADNVDGQ